MATSEHAVSFSLEGKVVVLVGASAGIGEWMAAGLDAAGATLVLGARRLEQLEAVAAPLNDAVAVKCDITDDGDRQALIQTALDRHGRIDGLVNNAGVFNVMPATKETPDVFRSSFEVNVFGPMELMRLALQSMRTTGGGSMVNVTSASANRTLGANTPAASYCASKAALAHLTRELAMQWGRYGVRVNSVAPGFFDTAMTGNNGAPPHWAENQFAIKRLSRGADMVGAVQYLLSDASSYITGTEIAVDGGQSKS
ncbi:MAG: SDR family NAD(P)-dependent oxidoreductase [Acidimicrobiia bacterium]